MKFPLLALLFTALSSAALAAPVSCPDLSSVEKVAACPTEEELRITFNGYCSDNARMYGKPSDVCTDFQLYRKMKNTALWESKDGSFHGYVSCDIAADKVKTMKPEGISVGPAGKSKMTRIACTYPEGVVFTYRTHDTCQLENADACKTNAAACTATCTTP